MSADKCSVALAQIDPRLGDVAANREIVAEKIAAARGAGADLVVFPELALTGYFIKDQVSAVAIRADSKDLKWLKDLSRRISIVVGLVEESAEALYYNAAMYFEGGELRQVHRKCYLPTYGLFDEQRYFARGRSLRAFDTRFGRTAMLICEDMWHPSCVYVNAADRALSLICISSSPIWGMTREEVPENAAYWERLTRFHAETWGIFVMYCNRVGFEDGVGFWGGSELIDPFGAPLAKAPYYEAAMTLGEIDMRRLKRKRISSTMMRDEDIDLTIAELTRIRTGSEGRAPARAERATPASSKHAISRRPRS
jgi:predicted amidohydrolase